MAPIKKYVNKGTLSGLVTVATGILAIVESFGTTPPGLLISVLAVLSGLVTTKDSADQREE